MFLCRPVSSHKHGDGPRYETLNLNWSKYPVDTAGVKRPVLVADHRLQTSAEVKNTCIYTSTPPVHLYAILLNYLSTGTIFTGLNRKKQDGRVWIGFIWLRIWTSGRDVCEDNMNIGVP
jgi:hypothetical protein